MSISFHEIVKVQAITKAVQTQELFDKGYKESSHSPIDSFLLNSNQLNLLWIGHTSISRELATVVFLGYMSAVESYIRALVRGIIQIDIHSQNFASAKEIKFGAAMHHNKKLLAEALMDEDSFVHMDNIRSTFKNLLDINLPINENTAKEFNNICQLRHCCVHRFGKLGAKNAMKLGINSHSSLLEKPLNLDSESLELIAKNLRSILKDINNTAYKEVLNRTFPIPKNKDERKRFEKNGIKSLWKEIYSDDRELFLKYYNLFSTKIDASKTPKPSVMYKLFIEQRNKARPTTDK
ncbi:hypothetical protein G5C64_14680 [Vibrio diabolicus]|uniref:hypothetical protein n=1 Tax=Vibrio diabolicus TaxID=50719 RepID=UPI00080F56FF|nr:hypothetical protein [Vibrio diabolicus]MCE3220077.1 hypothetical protein [Vibrio diabolicus]MDF4734944.1 hypothetical protein [Vibrio parahaemolyticus]MDG2607651.1 hypothetical protein [Vibrio parahaemolyticus]OCH72279.1 hypothetical protein A6E00_16485 [Vibrio diabolicus]